MNEHDEADEPVLTIISYQPENFTWKGLMLGSLDPGEVTIAPLWDGENIGGPPTTLPIEQVPQELHKLNTLVAVHVDFNSNRITVRRWSDDCEETNAPTCD